MSKSAAAFQVTPWSHRMGGLVERYKGLVLRLAEMESDALADMLDAQPIKQPVFVCGLARSGTTILLEALAAHPDVATHRYSDYPFIHLPYWWGKLSSKMLKQDAVASERAHGDRIVVSPHSPEAMEEALWMSFFTHLHGENAKALLDASTSNSDFERHYRNHIAKLLLVRERGRYVSKGNYNISRLAYLQKMLPDARFIVPVREPSAHVASLMRQHRHFSAGLVDNAKGREHLRRIGHFEFGPEREAIAVADMRDIEDLWAKGEEVRGWARYWSRLNGFVLDQMKATNNLNGAVRLLRYEDLCANPLAELTALFHHAGLPAEQDWLTSFANRISAPDYYSQGFSDKDRGVIAEETAATAQRLGYQA